MTRLPPPPFGDIQLAVIDAITHLLPTPDHLDIETPQDLQDYLPFVRVTRYGGGRDTITDRPALDIDVLDPSRATALALANRIEAHLTSRYHRTTTPAGVVVLDRARTIVGPFEPPKSTSTDGPRIDPNLRRITAAYNVSARRVWA